MTLRGDLHQHGRRTIGGEHRWSMLEARLVLPEQPFRRPPDVSEARLLRSRVDSVRGDPRVTLSQNWSLQTMNARGFACQHFEKLRAEKEPAGSIRLRFGRFCDVIAGSS